MITVAQRRKIKALLAQGDSKASVARATGVSLRSVKRIAKEPDLGANDAEERQRRGIGRPSVVREFRGLVDNLLREDPRLKSTEILQHVRSGGYAGGKSAMYSLIASIRRERATRPRGVPETRPGLAARQSPAQVAEPRKQPRLDGPGSL